MGDWIQWNKWTGRIESHQRPRNLSAGGPRRNTLYAKLVPGKIDSGASCGVAGRLSRGPLGG